MTNIVCTILCFDAAWITAGLVAAAVAVWNDSEGDWDAGGRQIKRNQRRVGLFQGFMAWSLCVRDVEAWAHWGIASVKDAKRVGEAVFTCLILMAMPFVIASQFVAYLFVRKLERPR